MEIGIVLIIALIVFGPKRLPELGKSLGQGIREFKSTIDGSHEDRSAATVEHKVPIEPGGTEEGEVPARPQD
jgi:sec-independent protein translocase protein TatA